MQRGKTFRLHYRHVPEFLGKHVRAASHAGEPLQPLQLADWMAFGGFAATLEERSKIRRQRSSQKDSRIEDTLTPLNYLPRYPQQPHRVRGSRVPPPFKPQTRSTQQFGIGPPI